MITNNNFFEVYKSLDDNHNDQELKEFHELMEFTVNASGWEGIDNDPSMAVMKQDFFELLAQKVKESGKGAKKDNHGKSKPKKAKPVKETLDTPNGPIPLFPDIPSKPPTVQSTRPKTPRTRPEKPKPNFIREKDIELRLIARFVALHGKLKTYPQVLSVHSAINRSISRGQVRKTHNPTPYHKEIIYAQEKLTYLLDHGFKNKTEAIILQFDPDKIEELRALTKGFAVFPSVPLALRFVGMEGKAPDVDKAQGLLNAIEKAINTGKIEESDPNYELIPQLKKALKAYIKGTNDVVEIHQATLAGLHQNLAGCGCQLKKSSLNGLDHAYGGNEWDDENDPDDQWDEDYIPPPRGDRESYRSDQLPKSNEDTLRFTGRWAELLNQPTRGFSAIFFGMPKNGKSTLSADLGGYLAKNFGPVLYASIEEGVRGTFTERIDRLRVATPNMDVKNYLPRDLSGYQFVIIDSASRGNMEVHQMRQVLNDWPSISFFFLTHTTKQGLPRGSNEILHEVDVIVEVKDGIAKADGRFGPGEMEVRFE